MLWVLPTVLPEYLLVLPAMTDSFTEGFLRPTRGEERSVRAATAEGLSIRILHPSIGGAMPEGRGVAELTVGTEVCGGHQGRDAAEGLGKPPQRAPTSRPAQGEVGCCRTSSQVCADKLAPASSPSATHTDCGAFPQDQNQSLQALHRHLVCLLSLSLYIPQTVQGKVGFFLAWPCPCASE